MAHDPEWNETFDELERIQREVIERLQRAAALRVELDPALLEPMREAPVETILQDMMVSASAQATIDRKQVARLVVLLDRLNLKVDGLESAATLVASDLAAAQQRADLVQGEPGAAADAGMQSPRIG